MSLNNRYKGLSAEEVLQNRQKYGENTLSEVKKEPLWKQFLEKFKDPIIKILLSALLFSFTISFYEFSHKGDFAVFLEPVGILFAIILATGIAFYFEVKANKQFEILNQVNDEIFYKVIRDFNVIQILKKEIVVGDIIILEAGEEIPADGKLLETISMQVNESSLTGEPMVHKTTNPQEFENEATYPSNYIYRGTSVSEGRCVFQVEKVGDATQYGQVFEGVQIDDSIKTPLNYQLDNLAKLITKLSYGIASLVVLGRLLVYFTNLQQDISWFDFGSYLLNTFMIAVTIIVVAVPEGLPMSVTLSLAYSMRSMMKTNNLVRKMHACETMGATTTICTDKTGTLTQNQMRIHEVFFGKYSSEGVINPIVSESIAVNSTAFLNSEEKKIEAIGNPTEGALLLWLHSSKEDYLKIRNECPVVKQLTFSTERKYMATLVQSKALNKVVLYVKGAPEIVMNFCKSAENKLNSEFSEETISEKLRQYQSKAMRTIGFAYKEFERESDFSDIFKNGVLNERNLDFIGIVAISDPVRPDVPASIKECLNAGIKVKIVTGDTSGTAKEIARQIGLWDDNSSDKNHISGNEFALLSDEELSKKLDDICVISRARPLDKARLVHLLQQKGEVVAVTGDGTNDAPALKAAQVGLSMGDGTSVAKKASDITILDNSFSSIGKAVMWGRSLYLNIQRFILFQLTINVVACLIVLIGAFLGTESPLTVTQMLWVNLIMDTFAALALASLRPSKKVMNDAPRDSRQNIISKEMSNKIFGVGIFFVILLYGLLQYFKNVEVDSLTDFSLSEYMGNFFNFNVEGRLSAYELSLFFSVFVMLQFWNMFNAKAYRTGKSAFSQLLQNKGFLMIAIVIILGQIFITSLGGKMFSVTPLKSIDWLFLILGTSFVLIIPEIFRMFSKKSF